LEVCLSFLCGKSLKTEGLMSEKIEKVYYSWSAISPSGAIFTVIGDKPWPMYEGTIHSVMLESKEAWEDRLRRIEELCGSKR
jgi:hypothetical protein